MNNQNQPSRGALKGRIHCKIFLSEHSWNIVSGAFHEPWNTFMKYFYFSIWMSLRMFLTNTKNCIYREKISSDSKNLIALIFINNICCSKQKQKNKKRPKRIWIKPWLKNRNDKKACVSLFLELRLTDKFQHYLRMNVTSCYLSYIDFFTLIVFYIFYYLHLYLCIDYFDGSRYTNVFNLLQYTFFIFTNNFFSITQLKQ